MALVSYSVFWANIGKRLGNRLHRSGIDVGLFDAVGEKFQKVSFAVGVLIAS